MVKCPKIVLLASKKTPNYKIAEESDIVSCWWNRFLEKALSGIEKDLLVGENHDGGNSQTKVKPRSKTIRIITQEKMEGTTKWSIYSFARKKSSVRIFDKI